MRESGSARRSLRALAWCACLLLAACSGSVEPGAAPSPGASAATSTSVPTASTEPTPTEPTPSPSAPTAPTARVTVGQLEDYLEEQYGDAILGLAGAPYVPGGIRGGYSCQCDGRLRAGDALTCLWDPVCEDPAGCGPAQWPETQTVLVTVLDDGGRFTFVFLDAGAEPYRSSPDDYPAGTDSCATLAAAPAGQDARSGLAYPALLHHWVSLGRPATMDSDGDGRPCEDHYPAEVVSQVLASPLSAAPGPDPASLTTDDVRAHAQALVGGFFWTTRLWHCRDPQPATVGATMACEISHLDMGWSQRIYLVVLDDDAGYTIVRDPPVPDTPALADYPADSTCSDLSRPPPDPADRNGTVSPMYGAVYYRWRTLGSPASWDQDGDGRPCEDTFSSVDWFFSQRLLRP